LYASPHHCGQISKESKLGHHEQQQILMEGHAEKRKH
jgi:hypothetical protein